MVQERGSIILHKQKDPADILKKSLRIYLSYIIYGLVFLGIGCIIYHKTDLTRITDLFIARPGGIWGIPFFGPFWFIIMLLLVKIMASIIPLNKLTLFISIGLFFGIFFISKKIPVINNLPFAISQSLLMFCFYVIGYLSRDYLKQITWRLSLSGVLLFLILGAISIIYFGGQTEKLVNYHNLKMFNPVMAFLLAILGSLTLFSCAEFIAGLKNRVTAFFQTIGEYTFTYFAWHMLLFFVIGYFASMIGLHGSVLYSVFKLLMTITITYISVKVITSKIKVSPFLVSIILFK